MLKRLAATAIILVMGASAAWAQQPPPADSIIKGAYDDVARYQKQFDDNPNAAAAKRILRLLTITEQRLGSSKNQADPSYAAASDALAGLKQQLDAAATGKPAPAAQQAAPAAQPAAPAGASSDPAVQQATADLAALSAKVDTMAAGDKANGRAYLDELKPIGEVLRGVSNKDAAWKQAAATYNDLQKRIVEVANASAPAGSQPAQAAGSGKPDPNIERALRDLKFTERNVDNLRADNLNQEQKILAELKRIGDVIGAAPDRAHPTWQEALEFRAALYLKLAKKRLGAIATGLEGIEKAVQNSPSVEFLNPDVMNKVTDAIAGYSRQLDVYGFYKDKTAMFQDTPGLLAVFDKPDQIMAQMDKRAAEAKASEGQLGDVAAEVDAIEARMKAAKVPASLNGQKFTPATVEAYVAEIQKLQAEVAKDAQYLQMIKGRTDKVDKQRLDRLLYWVGNNAADKIKSSVSESQAMMGIVADGAQRLLDFHATDDPADPNHQANRFLGENQYEENLARFDEQLDYVRGAIVFEAAFGPDRKAEREALVGKLEAARAKYQADHRTAVGAVRISKGVGDDELRKIAREVLTSGRYEGVGEIMRIETTKKTHRKETRGTITGSGSGNSATVSTNLYEWDEFQAHTVEKQGDRFIIFHSTMKYFYSGDSTTPLDRWLVSGRFSSTPILEENIDK